MSDKKISDLVDGSPGQPTDEFIIARGGVNYKLPGSALRTALGFTVSSLSGGPPASPSDGDIWVATGVDANGTRWQFQYNAGSSSAYKWEFVGGPPATSEVATSEATTSTTATDLATVGPSLTLARAGDYLFEWGYTAAESSSGGGNAAAALFAGASNLASLAVDVGTISGSVYPASRSFRSTGRSAADVMKLKYSISNGVSTAFSARWLRLTPIRIS